MIEACVVPVRLVSDALEADFNALVRLTVRAAGGASGEENRTWCRVASTRPYDGACGRRCATPRRVVINLAWQDMGADLLHESAVRPTTPI